MTEDKDFKALIRARMAKTGESYTTARLHLLRSGEPTSEPAHTEAGQEPTTGMRFSLATPDAAGRAQSVRSEMSQNLYADAGVEVKGDLLEVWMGRPRAFEIAIPLAAIEDARRVPDGEPGGSLGIHGWRGKWLVNVSYEGLVRLTLHPPQNARLAMASSLPKGTAQRIPWFVRPLVRDRSPRVRELTISVSDPAALIEILGK